MKKPIVVIIVIILIVAITYKRASIKVLSNIDGKYYIVKNNKLSQKSADLLAQININLKKLVIYCSELSPKPVYSENLLRFKSENIGENILNLDTTYTINKGDSMVFCLSPRSYDQVELYDINTMMYVAVHELAHVASNSVGHTMEFKINFKDLLQKAVKIGVYSYINYEKTPVEYCGIKLTKSILN